MTLGSEIVAEGVKVKIEVDTEVLLLILRSRYQNYDALPRRAEGLRLLLLHMGQPLALICCLGGCSVVEDGRRDDRRVGGRIRKRSGSSTEITTSRTSIVR